jgi:hypothetical protein
MSKRIELDPETGQFCEVREVGELKHGDFKAVKAAVSVEINTKSGNSVLPGDYNERMNDVLAARIITSWNLLLPLPKGDPSVLEQLTEKQIQNLYDGIKEHVDAVNAARSTDPNEKGTDPTNG